MQGWLRFSPRAGDVTFSKNRLCARKTSHVYPGLISKALLPLVHVGSRQEVLFIFYPLFIFNVSWSVDTGIGRSFKKFFSFFSSDDEVCCSNGFTCFFVFFSDLMTLDSMNHNVTSVSPNKFVNFHAWSLTSIFFCFLHTCFLPRCIDTSNLLRKPITKWCRGEGGGNPAIN